ncbi:hypothetical protein JCM8097_000488 [Rhodosporidiobolus ruineniae]
MYLRFPRIFFFLLTTALCIVEIGLAAWSVAHAHDLQDETKRTLAGASLDVSDALAVGGAVTAAAAVSALTCVVLLVWTILRPRQSETLKSVRIKEGVFVFNLIFLLATLIASSYYTATKRGVISAPGFPQSLIDSLVAASGKDLRYSHSTPIVSYLVVGWIAWLSTLISLILVSIAARKTLKYGPDGTGPLAPGADEHERVDSRPSMSTTNNAYGEKAAPANTGAERFA